MATVNSTSTDVADVAMTDLIAGVVTLQDTVICSSLDGLRVPLAGRIVDELRGRTGRLQPEGTDDESGCLCSIDVRVRASVARLRAVAVIVSTNPAFFGCFLHVRVEPRASRHVVEARHSRRSGEQTAIQHDDQLGKFGARCGVATTKARLCGIKVTGVDEGLDGILVPHA